MKSRILLAFLIQFCLGLSIFAQTPDLTPWTNGAYGNEWINYNKKYVRIPTRADGMYQVSLAALQAKIPGLTAANIQGWFRGKQIALLIEGDNVIFYGRRNDGASDGMLYRPGPEARIDKNTSFFSENGANFFTAASAGEPVLRMTTVDATKTTGLVDTETYYVDKWVNYNGYFSDMTPGGYNPTIHSGGFNLPDRRWTRPFGQAYDEGVELLNNSFYEKQNAFLKETLPATPIDVNIALPGFISNSGFTTKMEYYVVGNGPGSRLVNVNVGPTTTNLTLLYSTTLNAYANVLRTESMTENTHISPTGAAVLRFSSPTANNVAVASQNRYGYSFVNIEYARSLSFSGQTNKRYSFKEGYSGKRRIEIPDAPSTTRAFNVTNPYAPVNLNGSLSGTLLTLDVDRVATAPLDLQVVSNITQIASTALIDVKFDLLFSSITGGSVANIQPDPSAFDYLVITHINTSGKVVSAGAVAYGQYRASVDGGGFNTMVISTRTIYDQFNYGEPSPLALKRFVNYMIQNGIRTEHNLLLVGHGIGLNQNITRELPDDVPTMGDPGSDVLMVCGLSNDPYSHIDVPAIPVGRIPAFTVTEVNNYLAKVRTYDTQTRTSNAIDLTWRRNVVDVVGYKKKSEIPEFETYFQNAGAEMVNLPGAPWNVTTLKNNNAPYTSEYTRVFATPLDTLINSGTGFVGYFGHGNITGTINNISDPTNPAKTGAEVTAKYQSTTRFPVLYVTGCGTGDVYRSATTLYPVAKWVVSAADKGAVVAIANSYLAYVHNARHYLQILYREIFGKSDTQRKTIGRIHRDLANYIILGVSSPNNRVAAVNATNDMIAHIQQSNLYGDPALNILPIRDPSLPVSYTNFEALPGESGTVDLSWETSWESNNDYFMVERSGDGKSFTELGRVNAVTSQAGEGGRYRFTDALPLKGLNYYRLKQWDLGSADAAAQFSYSKIVSVEVKGDFSETSVFPNPATDVFTIKSEDLKGGAEWQLVDQTGRVIIKGKGRTVNVKALNPGQYILIINQDSGEKIRRHVVKN